MDADKIVFISEYTGGGFGSKITGGAHHDHSRAAVEKAERPGNDAGQPRRGDTSLAAPAQALLAV